MCKLTPSIENNYVLWSNSKSWLVLWTMPYVYPKSRMPEEAGGKRSKLHKNNLFHSYRYLIGLLEKNQFACSKIILWILCNWMCSGKLTFSAPSTYQKNCAKFWREKKKIGWTHTSKKIHGEGIGWKKSQSLSRSHRQPMLSESVLLHNSQNGLQHKGFVSEFRQ